MPVRQVTSLWYSWGSWQPAIQQGGGTFHDFQEFHLLNGSNQGQNLALNGFFCSLLARNMNPSACQCSARTAFSVEKTTPQHWAIWLNVGLVTLRYEFYWGTNSVMMMLHGMAFISLKKMKMHEMFQEVYGQGKRPRTDGFGFLAHVPNDNALLNLKPTTWRKCETIPWRACI